ncbi:hypothetical protein gpAD87_25975 [Paenibacillus sp. AD87]|nr:hypothetical protein gpAD87_25975 [Paenibacillus sp. AD87]
MRKIMKTLLVGGLAFNLFAISAFADSVSEDDTHYRAPVETVKNGQKYIDGLPYYTQDDIKKIDLEQTKRNIKVEKLNEDVISTMGINKWTLVSQSSYYTGHDYDTTNNYSKEPAKLSVSTTSSMTAELSGSTKFGFFSVAEVDMSMKVGATFSRTTNIEVIVPGYNVTQLKTAVKAVQRNYMYTDNYSDDGSMGPEIRLSASSYDNNGGIEKWIFTHPM